MTRRTRDERFMALAVTQARRGEGRTRPNPPVGAVVVRGERVLARGYHSRAGAAHAEVDALGKIGGRARGAELYVTLEPCAHHGRTPPCADAILRAGIRRVVIGGLDPNPLTDGLGVARLRQGGVEVVTGVLAEPCARLLDGFTSLVCHGRPFVVLKLAATLDGRIATRTGHSRWITGEAARREVHRWRNRCDAILVGGGTVAADDPALTCRLGRGRDPLRVVLSGSLTIAPDAQVVTTPGCDGWPNALVVTTRGASASRAAALRAAGAEVVRLPSAAGRVRIPALLEALGQRGILSVLVEGGSQVAAQLLEGGHVDRLLWFVAPKIVGGAGAVPAVAGRGAARMDDALVLEDLVVRRLGADLLLDGRL